LFIVEKTNDFGVLYFLIISHFSIDNHFALHFNDAIFAQFDNPPKCWSLPNFAFSALRIFQNDFLVRNVIFQQ
jgi:hypothetical protein